jgi:hypothetical protein
LGSSYFATYINIFDIGHRAPYFKVTTSFAEWLRQLIGITN